MTKYFPYEVNLTESQRKSLQKTGQVVLRFTKDQLLNPSNVSKLLLTQGQINKISKCKAANKGVEIKLSKTQMHKNQTGGFLLPLAALASKLAPVAISGLSGLVSGLADTAVRKIAGNGVEVVIPKQDIEELEKAVQILESRNILPMGSGEAIRHDISQKGGAFVLPLVASLLGSFLPTLFRSKGNGVFLPWEKN